MSFDVKKIRRQFPILDQQVNGRPLVYLDSAASAQKPDCVVDAISDYYHRDHSNVHRGSHALGERATERYEQARITAAKFLNTPSERNICFTRGTTEGLNFLADALSHCHLQAGDEVIISHMEHHANIIPWQVAGQRHGIEVKVCRITPDGELDLDHYRELLASKRAKLVSLVHVSNVLGTINPVRQLTELAHEKNIPVILDGAQAVPHIPVDVSDIGCDFYVFSGHKAYGPTGIGVLYIADEWLERLPPYQTGGSMVVSATLTDAKYQPAPHRFEAGTPHIAGAAGLDVALAWLSTLGMDAVQAHGDELIGYALNALATIDDVEVIGHAQHRTSAITLVVDGCHAFDLSMLLGHHGIAVRAGHHCAMPLLHALGHQATLRMSFGVYNDTADIDACITALRQVITQLKD